MLHSSHSCDTPKVSVIVPCYNEPEDVFRRSLESVVGQTLKEIEIIIILDNPENKDLERIVLEYAMKYDNILIFNPGKNLGRGEARNFGISGARGEYLAIHDADDVDVPERLEKQCGLMEDNPSMSLTIGNVRKVDSQGVPIEGERIKKGENIYDHPSIFALYFNHATFFIKSDTMRKYDGYNNFQYGEDHDLFIRLLARGEQVIYSDQVFTDYLDPQESTHSDFFEKMRDTRNGAVKRLIHYYHDPKIRNDTLYKRVLIKNIGACIILNTFPKLFPKAKKLKQITLDFLRAMKKNITVLLK